jgi:hypothetical protein
VNAGLIAARKRRSATERLGSSNARRTAFVPSRRPARRSFKYSRAPVRKPGIDRALERDHAFRDAPGGGDHDRHHRARVEEDDLDVAH